MIQNYTLGLINNKTKETYKQFAVDGFNTIGVEELEDFSLIFRNNTSKRVQVRVSLDGTDILSGKPASTDPSGEMFIVAAYQSLNLKAWAEDTKGGASFLFTELKDSVASNTHGNTSSKGIIAVAVYEEGYVEPVKLNYPPGARATKGMQPQGIQSQGIQSQGIQSQEYKSTFDEKSYKESMKGN